ncbi:MAG: signal peptidase I [Ignavibacteriales bacterium]|nr:signal peptidase I [Ignavibacterium sp.]MCZ2268460.1 signal peptidase I [Ignavibacteriales bacterium]
MKKLFLTISLCTAAYLFVKAYFFELYTVSTSSMEPTLIPNDFVIVSKFSDRNLFNRFFAFTTIQELDCTSDKIASVQKGDLILFNPPLFIEGKKQKWEEPFIKRCIGLPGDSLKIKVNKYSLYDLVELNYYNNLDEKLSETKNYQVYIPRKGNAILLSDTLAPNLLDLILGEGHIFKKDFDGTILIDGKKSSTYIVQKDYYFFIGDNHLNSLDSRKFGFVSKENLLGKILCVAWSLNSKYDLWYKKINWERIGKIPK